MICHKHRCVFVHIPKTAGQSIEHYFAGRVGLDWKTERHKLLIRRATGPAEGTPKLAHLTAEEYLRCGHLNQDQFNSYFKFAFVRNPWKRLLSEYLYRNYFVHRSFRDFVLKKLPKQGFCDKHRHVMPQYDMIYGKDGRLLVDFVGRFEKLQADFDLVCLRLNIQDSTLPHVNRSEKSSRLRKRKFRNLIYQNREDNKKTIDDFYDQETIDAVAKVYRKDIMVFGYDYPGKLLAPSKTHVESETIQHAASF